MVHNDVMEQVCFVDAIYQTPILNRGAASSQEEMDLGLPEGMSTEAIGIVTCRREVKTWSKGALTDVPLKLKPKMASTTTWYSESISAAEGREVRKGRCSFSH